MWVRIIKVSILLAMIIIGFSILPVMGFSPNDDFSSNRIDDSKWIVGSSSIGTIAPTDNGLMLRLSPTRFRPLYTVGLKSKWLISGDFDIEFDFRILKWSPESRIRVGLCVKRREDRQPHEEGGCAERVGKVKSWGGVKDVYLAHFKDGLLKYVETKDLKCRLRLVREGTMMTGFYLDNGRWVPLHTGEVSEEPFEVGIGIWGHYWNPGVEVVFERFRVLKGRLIKDTGEVIEDIGR